MRLSSAAWVGLSKPGVCAPKDAERWLDVSRRSGHGFLHPQHVSVLNFPLFHQEQNRTSPRI